MRLLLLISIATLTSSLPQNWPYRDTGEYYGYQQRRNLNRNVPLTSVSEEDDEVEVQKSARQDLKVASGTETQTLSAAPQNVQVVETGSAKPVQSELKNTQQVQQPNVGQQQVQNKQPPAFPPATPPPSQKPAETEDSEEDSEEEDADDAEDEEQDEEESEEEERKRSEDVSNVQGNVTSVKNVVEQEVGNDKQPPHHQQPPLEALVPGYVTPQGEVLVPFDTVVKDSEGGVVAVVEDPNYEKNKPPVVILPSEENEQNNIPDQKQVPKFFQSLNNQIYYSDVPPPGSIFTFDEDEDNEVNNEAVLQRRRSGLKKKARQGDSSEEEDDNTSTYSDENTSSSEDDFSEEEQRSSKNKPPLSFVKATSPSGEDDEAESLGIRVARRADVSRSPHFYHVGNGYYVSRYPQEEEMSYEPRRPPQFYPGNYYQDDSSPVIYYYRPASKERVKVVPVGSFDVSVEHNEGGVIRGVKVSPMNYYQQTNRRVSQQPRPQLIRRRPTVQQSNRPRRPLPQSNRPTPVIIRRGQNQGILALYNIEGGTQVQRMRGSQKKRREARKNKKVEKDRKKKVVNEDQLGLLKKVKKTQEKVTKVKKN